MPNDSRCCKPANLREAGVGDRGLVQIEPLQSGEASDRIEARVAGLRDLQVQCLQPGQTGEVGELRIADRG